MLGQNLGLERVDQEVLDVAHSLCPVHGLEVDQAHLRAFGRRVLEAIAEAVRWSLPVLFLIEDNQYAISTTTAEKTLYSHPNGNPDSFYGVPITQIDGRDVQQAHSVFGNVVSQMREDRLPAIIRMSCDRLTSHTNADDQRTYRKADDIEQVQQTGDPITRLRQRLLEWDVPAEKLDSLEAQVKTKVRKAGERALRSPEPSLSATDVVVSSGANLIARE